MNTNKLSRLIFSFLFLSSVSLHSFGQKDGVEPWKENQLMPAEDLAKLITDENVQKPVIFNIGPAAKIKGSIYIGPTKEKDNLKNLKEQLTKLPKDADIVIYCGCCPFGNCPNIRPAFELLNNMKFINHKLLSLQKNIKVDWIDKGYPMDK